MFDRKLMIAALATGICDVAFGAVEKYIIDPNHTYPSIEFSHMGISIWRGKFDRTKGTVTLDRASKTGTVDIAIDAASIDFGLDTMNEKARSEDFFDVTRFPTATYRGSVQFVADTPRTIDGQVTIMGVTRSMKLIINSFNCILHPAIKKEVCGADAEGDLNWSEFGMKMSKYGQGDAGKVHLRIQVEAIKQD